MKANGAIVLVAKCPIPGKSKTRLTPLLGSDGAASLARAMLSDILVTLLSSFPENVLKVLLYAPGNEEGEAHMVDILKDLGLPYTTTTADDDDEEEEEDVYQRWILLPMVNDTSLQSSDLGGKLSNGLNRVRTLQSKLSSSSNENGDVVFLGMDSPELPLHEISHALQISSQKAHLCPANDGGYGMLCVPSHAPCPTIFEHVQWSTHLTAVSQLKALTDCGVEVSLGKLMFDIDEMEDVRGLAGRLCNVRNGVLDGDERMEDVRGLAGRLCNVRNGVLDGDERKEGGVLERCTPGAMASSSLKDGDGNMCLYTWDALMKLSIILKQEGENEDGQDRQFFILNDKAFASC
uniref:Glycosyltransferase n=1 Tax=Ditylum brightwellii TaxID=49249 RepID=A0A7S4QUD2_9STRA